MKEVLVLMSTYNGEMFLEEQLSSIFAQEGVSVSLLVRDDGSTDSTCEILASWQQSHPLEYIRGENVGSARSFLELMKMAPNKDFYAFSDQDDIWYPDKLSRALNMLSAGDDPQLYFANVDLTDAEGHVKQKSLKDNLQLTKYNCLIESYASGCTMVFNDALRQIVCRHIPGETIYHDRWLYLTAMFFGQVIYEGQSCMGYRQHSSNLVGTQTEAEKGSKIKRLLSKGDFSMSDTADLFLRYYGSELTEQDKRIVKVCTHYKTNLWYKGILLFHPDYRLADCSFLRNIYWKMRILLNRL